MSTPREIKAVDVVRGMRVRVTQHYDGHHGSTVETIEGEVIAVENANLQFGNGAQRYLGYDHPVTVLAEPEPEWVEGAWYWASVNGSDERPVRRVGIGWTPYREGSAYWTNPDTTVDISGRFLAVDWPWDDVAEVIEDDNPPRTEPTDMTADDYAAQIIADAIRTQGGAR